MQYPNIEPIKLLAGNHEDTGTTGQGCFMNVISYLNGEPQITDKSPCVCHTIRPIAILLNDYMKDDERQQLLPFVMRAMGTATTDRDVINARLKQVVKFANDISSYIPEDVYPGSYNAAKYAEIYANKSIDYGWLHFEEYAMNAALYTMKVVSSLSKNYYIDRQKFIERALALMDAVCPPLDEPSQCVVDRVNQLVELASV